MPFKIGPAEIGIAVAVIFIIVGIIGFAVSSSRKPKEKDEANISIKPQQYIISEPVPKYLIKLYNKTPKVFVFKGKEFLNNKILNFKKVVLEKLNCKKEKNENF